MSLHGLTQINVETNSTCDKRTKCGFCAHQNPALHPNLKLGEMAIEMMLNIAFSVHHLGKSLTVQLHKDGDPLAASEELLCQTLFAFRDNLRSIVTHGCTLSQRGQALIGNVEAVCVSIFREDPDRDLQLESLRSFLDQKGSHLPRGLLKVVGDMSTEELAPYQALSIPMTHRRLHIPINNSRYVGGLPAIPESGICQDLLHHPSISWDGRVWLCNRFQSDEAGVIGDLATESLDAIWNGPLRASYVQQHLDGMRAAVPPCRDCQYYGIPTS